MEENRTTEVHLSWTALPQGGGMSKPVHRSSLLEEGSWRPCPRVASACFSATEKEGVPSRVQRLNITSMRVVPFLWKKRQDVEAR